MIDKIIATVIGRNNIIAINIKMIKSLVIKLNIVILVTSSGDSF